MALDLKIDPVTRDYVDDGAGGWLETDDVSTAVFLQVECERDKWWGDFSAGSRIKETLRADIQEPNDVFDDLSVAMKDLARAGLISDLHIEETDVDTASGSAGFLLTWLDRHSNRPGDLSYSPLGGNPTVV